MKKTFAALLPAFFAALALQASTQLIQCETKVDMRSAFTRDQEYITLSENGRSGKCFKITCPADRKGGILFHPWTQPMIKVESASAPVKVTVWVKGKGRGSFGFLSYTRDKKIFYPPKTNTKFEADSSDKWMKLELSYTPEAGKEYANKVGFIMPYISIEAGSEILFDDLETELTPPKNEIKIEE